MLLRQLQPGWSATLLYAVLEPRFGRVTVASAAHPPPLVRHTGRMPEYADVPPSVPLAVVRAPNYTDVTFDLPPDSTIVLYTDGLVERHGESLDIGLNRLRRVVDSSVLEPESVCRQLMSELLADGPGADDAAVLVVVNESLPDPFVLKLPVDLDSIPVMRRVMRRWLDGAGASPEEVKEITLACSEACANAVEHASGPGGSDFVVEAASIADGITLAIRDTGRWREPRGKNRGRGMPLMRGLMDSVDVERLETGTVLRMSRRLNRKPA